MTDEERAANKQKYPAPEVTRFVGREEAFWHFQPNARIEVHSELTITARPQDADVLPIRLPYGEGQLESVVSDQMDLSFEQGQEDGSYTIPLPVEPVEKLTCIWSLPLEAIHADYGYGIELKSLIPIIQFKLHIVLEPGCGMACKYTDETTLIPFTIGSANWDASRALESFGRWTGLQKAQ